MTLLSERSWGHGPDCSPAIGRDSCRDRLAEAQNPGHPRRAGRGHPVRPPLPPPPAARNAPLTRRPAARRQHAPRTWTPGRPPRRPADKAHTTTRTPQPEVGPRPRPGNFRCCSRRAGALGDLHFRPGAGRGKRERGGRGVAASTWLRSGSSASAPRHLRAWPVTQCK